MNWCFNVTLLVTLLAGLVDCRSAAFASDGLATNGGTANRATALLSDDEEKLTISKIMKLAHKSGLLKKVATGKASDEEITELHKFYAAMPELAPPKGEKKSWQEKTTALVEASQAAVDKDPQAGAMLKAATNCAACHQVHKPNDND